jgi:hypothetical protein
MKSLSRRIAIRVLVALSLVAAWAIVSVAPAVRLVQRLLSFRPRVSYGARMYPPARCRVWQGQHGAGRRVWQLLLWQGGLMIGATWCTR